ncbi:MAG: hypothetical protein FJW68_00830 [Actinobacteria bacterium]|nr:hypothetical protein [Actinomycetota bacterium]
MRYKKILFYFFITVLILLMILPATSCISNKKLYDASQKMKKINQEFSKTEGVIGLLDSLGVGDVPNYPGSTYDYELNMEMGEFKNQLIDIPTEFYNVLYTVYVIKASQEQVIDFYNNKMQELQWEKTVEQTSDKGSLNAWRKTGYDEVEVIYILLSGTINYSGRQEFVILKGFIINENNNNVKTTGDSLKEGNEIGPGSVYFENPGLIEGEGLLMTKPVSSGVEQWQKWLQDSSGDNSGNEVLLKDDPMFIKVAEFSRKSGAMDGGAAGIYQELDLDLQDYSSVNIWLTGKVIYEEGGNIANVNKSGFPEGAMQVRIKYLDKNDEIKEWHHGFFYSNITYYDKLNYSLVTKDKWFWYISPNLLELDSQPQTIKEIRIYGFGWQFTGQFAEINIIGNKG